MLVVGAVLWADDRRGFEHLAEEDSGRVSKGEAILKVQAGT